MHGSLTLTEEQHRAFKEHLFPGDDREAVIFALCGQRADPISRRFMVRALYPVPHEVCLRTSEKVSWPTDHLLTALLQAEKEGLVLLKAHSHPSRFPAFSDLDDISDLQLLDAARNWIHPDSSIVSAVMLPDGKMFGRILAPGPIFQPLSKVVTVGDDIRVWPANPIDLPPREQTKAHALAFGARTTNLLRELRVGVVGCSGTGSPVVEQLARLGIGSLVLVDPDHVESRNLNRILNATQKDADDKVRKVEVMARAVDAMGLGTEVVPLALGLHEPEAITAIGSCDVVFGCMDGYEGRYILSLISNHYSLPYFDLGVGLKAAKGGEIESVAGSVHYLQPGGSTLFSRHVITFDQVTADNIRRKNPALYEGWKQEKYIKGVDEERPGVISINMQIAALGVTEMLARLHPFRDDSNREFAAITFDNCLMDLVREPEGDPCPIFRPMVGRGDRVPLLGKSEFAVGGQR